MRKTWMLASAGTLVFISSAKGALNWYTVVGPSDTVADGDTFGFASQVVVGSDGTVAVVGTSAANNYDFIAYSPALVDSPTTVVDSSVVNSPSSFTNLAVSSNPSNGIRLSYVGETSDGNAAIYQYNVNSASGTTVEPLTTPPTLSASNGSLPIAVNQSGQIAYPNDSGGVGPAYNTSGFTVDPTSHIVLNADGTATTLLTSNTGLTNGDVGVYQLSGSAAPVPVDAPITGPMPDQVFGSSSSGAGITLYETSDGSGNSTLEMTIGNAITGTTKSLGTYATGTIGSLPEAAGEVTPNGKIAAYVPAASGTSIQSLVYVDTVTGPSTVITAASVGETVVDAANPSPTLVITQLQNTLNTPMVSSQGTILFDGTIDPSTDKDSSLTEHALMDWQPGDTNPNVLLAAGDTVYIDIDGTVTPETLIDFDISSLAGESDYFKNAINGNFIAVDAYYNPSDPTLAVIEVALPEPGVASLLPVAGIALVSRRRRKA